MNSENAGNTGAASPIEMKTLLGPPPILSTESAERFGQVFDQLIACLKPQDMVEGILVWEFAIPSWEINRYTRHRTVSFDRSFKQSLDFQVQRVKTQKARKEQLASDLAAHLTLTPSDIAHPTRLETEIKDLSSEIAEILKRTPSELDHCHALEKSLAFHKDVEFLITSLTKRRNEALQMLDFYRAGLGKRVEEAMGNILDAEYKLVQEQPQQSAAPPIVPAETGEAEDCSTPASSGT